MFWLCGPRPTQSTYEISKEVGRKGNENEARTGVTLTESPFPQWRSSLLGRGGVAEEESEECKLTCAWRPSPCAGSPPPCSPDTQSREGWARRPGAPSGGRAAGPTTGALPKTMLPTAEGTRHAESFRARRSAKDKPGPGGSLDARTGQEPAPRLEATRRSLVLNGPSLGLRRAPRRDSADPDRAGYVPANPPCKGDMGTVAITTAGYPDTPAAEHAWALVLCAFA